MYNFNLTLREVFLVKLFLHPFCPMAGGGNNRLCLLVFSSSQLFLPSSEELSDDGLRA